MNATLLQGVVAQLEELKDDADAGKRFKEKTEEIISILTTKTELAVDKALLKLEELNSSESSSYHRTQVWGVITQLESIKR